MQFKTLEESSSYLNEIAIELTTIAELDKMEMYRLLGQYGDNIVPLVTGEKIENNFVHGCISNVYLAHSVNQNHIYFRGHSDTMIVRGYLAILINGLSGLSLSDLLKGSAEIVERFCELTDVRAHLTPTRANAFGNIYALMRQKAENEHTNT